MDLGGVEKGRVLRASGKAHGPLQDLGNGAPSDL